NLHMAYDTFGVREFFQELADGKGTHFEDLLDGFYIQDSTPDNPLFSISGNIALGVGASAGIFSASVGGGVSPSNDVSNPSASNADDPDGLVGNLHDPNSSTDDGKLRFSKIGADASDPKCVFEVGGELNAGAAVTVKVGVDTPLGFVGYEHTFNIAAVELISVNVACLQKGSAPAANPPIIAGDPSTGMGVVDGSGTLTLFL